MGTGCARGFLAAFDTAWMVRAWAQGRNPVEVLAERYFTSILNTADVLFDATLRARVRPRPPSVSPLLPRESVYRLLPQTTPDNVSKNFEQYSIDPATRYPNLNASYVRPHQVRPANAAAPLWEGAQKSSAHVLI